jgi:hypothetical protein
MTRAEIASRVDLTSDSRSSCRSRLVALPLHHRYRDVRASWNHNLKMNRVKSVAASLSRLVRVSPAPATSDQVVSGQFGRSRGRPNASNDETIGFIDTIDSERWMTNIDIDDYQPHEQLQKAISPVSANLLCSRGEQQRPLPWLILIVRHQIDQQPLYFVTSSDRGVMSPIMERGWL